MIPTKKEERLGYFQDLYEKAKIAFSAEQELLRRHMAQYRGSCEIDGSPTPATAIRNITYEIIEGQISSTIPAPKVSPLRVGEAGERNATAIERLCARLRDELPFERLNDLDERYTTIYGASVWLVEWDSTIERAGERGGIRVSCLSPESFIPQPHMEEIADMEYCFLRFSVPRAELRRRYGIDAREELLADAESDSTITDEDTVTVVTCFYKDGEGQVGRFVFSGGAILSDLADYYGRKRRVCTRCHAPHGECNCNVSFTFEEVDEEMLPLPAEDGLTKRTGRVAFYRPRRFPVVLRKNISRAGSCLGQSDCEVIRPQQQQINKLESRIQAKLMRSGITPIMPEGARVCPDNSIFGQVLRLAPGESASMYGVIDTTPDISQEIAQSNRLYEQARRIVGISDSFVGLSDDTASSGYAKRLQIEQAAGRLDSKRRMKEAAYADIDRLIFEFTLAYADEEKRVSYRDAYGRLHESCFNRYDFLFLDERSGRFLYDDAYLFATDKNGGIEQQREALWSRNLENLRAGTLGDPGDPVTLLRYWQNQERAHYPYARENVEYFSDVLKNQEERGEIYEANDQSEC